MTAEERLEVAVRSPEPARALRALVLELSREHYTKETIYALLEQLVLRLRAQGGHRASDEEAVLEAMDALAGWCHPDARLLPED